MVAANLLLNLALVWPMRESGLALASSLSAYGNLVLLLALLRKKAGPLGLRPVAWDAARSGFAALAAGAGGWGTWKAFMFLGGMTERFGSFGAEAIGLGAALAVAGIAYLSACWMLGSRDARALFRMLRRANDAR